MFVINCSDREPAEIACSARGKSVEQWDPTTGKRTPVPAATWSTTLPPAGSALFAVYNDKQPRRLESPPPRAEESVWTAEKVSTRAEGPNVLPLDYVDLVLDGTTTEGIFILDAQTRIYRQYGFTKNPWDNSVQYAG